MKKLIPIFLALLCTTTLLAQSGKFPIFKEIASVEHDNTGEVFQLVNVPVEGVNHYYILVGRMGIGDLVFQIDIDPVNLLYIPLGTTITDALAYMEELKTLYKEPKGTMREIQASFQPFFPGQELQTIKVYRHQPLLSNQLQFVIECDGYQRVAYLNKSDFNALMSGLKFYGKLYPSEM